MYDTLSCNKAAGMPLPSGLNDDFMLEMKFIYDFVYLYTILDPVSINPLYSSPLMRRILSKILKKLLIYANYFFKNSFLLE